MNLFSSNYFFILFMRIIVEANIGSGKTTLLKKLEEKLNVNVIYEPVDTWTKIQDSKGENLLGYFYQDIKRWAYTFQSVAFRTRIQEMEKKVKNDSINIIERSVYTDRNVFAKNCHSNGLMNDIEWFDYTNWHDWLCTKFDIQPDLYIYLRVDPEVSFARLQKRSRHEEDGVPLDYLRQIHQRHEEWLMGLDNVIIIDGNIEFETDPQRLDEIINIIRNAVEKKAD